MTLTNNAKELQRQSFVEVPGSPGTPARRVYSADQSYVIENGNDSSIWSGSADVSNITVSNSNRTGSTSISFDKDGATETTGIISATVNLNLDFFALQKLKVIANLSSLTDIASVSLRIGTDASNMNVYTTADTALSAGWNELDYDADSPTSVSGDGVDWLNVTYVAFVVTFDGAGDTLTDILLDSISAYKQDESGGSVASDVNVSKVGGTAISTGNGDTDAGTQRTVRAGATHSNSGADAESFVDANATIFKGAYGFIDASAASGIYYIQFYDLAAEPADATAVETDMPAPIEVNHTINSPTPWQLDLTDAPRVLDNGIVMVCSTTKWTKTETGDICSFSLMQ